MSDFSANRSRSLEARLRALEDDRTQQSSAGQAALDQTGSAANTMGGGSAAVAAASPSGSSSPSSLAGDVTGPAGSNLVEKVQHTTFPAPVAGDDEKFVRYQHGTPAYEYAHVPLTGDASGTNAAVVVDKAKGIPFPTPVAGDDEKGLAYDHGTVAYVLRRYTSLTLLGAWTSADISLLGTTDVEILNCFAGDTALSVPMPRSGAVVAVGVQLSGDVDGGAGAGNNFTATVYKNGVATTITATVTGAASTEIEATADLTPVTFAAGDNLTVFAKETGTAAAVRASVTVWGYINPV